MNIIIVHESTGRNFIRANTIMHSCRRQSASSTIPCLLNFLKNGTQMAALSTLIVNSEVGSTQPIFHRLSPSRLQLLSQGQVGRFGGEKCSHFIVVVVTADGCTEVSPFHMHNKCK
jgi:hypothetical protein